MIWQLQQREKSQRNVPKCIYYILLPYL